MKEKANEPTESNQYEKLKLEEKEGVLIITLNSPDTLNALESKLLEELENTIEKIWYSKYSGVIITGEGKAFSSGANIQELYNLENFHQTYEYLRRGQRVLSKVENLKFITVAAINGYALGGGLELALACTFRIATKNAKLGLPEINLGIIPGYGGTQRLTRLIGVQKSKKIIMDGRHISAEEAYELGIVDKLCETQDELIKTSIETIKSFESKYPTALRYVNELCNLALGGDFDDNLKTEALFCASLISSDQAKSKMKNFLEKMKKKS